MDREFIKVNRDIHEIKRVNVVFDILHVFYYGSINLLRIGKILAKDHDPFEGRRGICLLEGSPQSPRCGGGGEKLHESGRDGSNNFIKKQLIMSELKSIVRIWGGTSSIRQSFRRRRTQL